MPITVSHALSATTPDDPQYEIRPSHWNQSHLFTVNASGSEISGAFSNAGNVTFGLETNGFITASANAAGAGDGFNRIAAGTQTAGTNATVAFVNSNGITFGMSNSTQVTASHNGITQQSTQPVAFNAGGVSSNFSTLVFQDSNGVSFSNNAGSIRASVKTDYAGTGTTTAGNNISLSATLNSDGLNLSASVAAPGGAGFSAGVSGGNTSNTSGVTGTRVVFAGGNNITLSQSNDANGASITISGANVGGAQTGISGVILSNTTYTSGTVSFRDLNGITWQSTTGQALQITHDLQYTSATSAITSNALHSSASRVINIVAATNNTGGGTASVSGNVSFTNANGATFYTSAGPAVALSYTVPTVTNSSLTMQAGASTLSSVSRVAFVDSNGVSFGASTSNNGSITITATVRTDWLSTQSNQAASASNGSFTFQTLNFSNANNVTFGTSAGGIVTASVNAGGGGAAISAGANSQNTGTVNFANSNNVTFGLSNNGTMTADVRLAASNSAGSFTFQTLNFSNANNVTFGTSAGGIITASVAAPGAAAEQNAINLLGANTAGNTTATGSTIGLSGLNLTLSGTNASQIVISAPATSSLAAFRGLTISSNGSTISVGHDFESFYENMGVVPASTFFTMRQSTSHVVPFVIPDALSANFIRLFMSASVQASSTAATTGNSQFSYGLTRSHNFVIYSRGVGASSQSLQSVTSTRVTEQQSINVSAAANSTQFSYTNRASLLMSTGTSGYTFDYSSNAASLNFHTSGMTGITGLKLVEMPFDLTLAPGQYWLAYGQSSSTVSQFNAQGSRLFNDYSVFGASQINSGWGTWNSATNNSVFLRPGLGSFTTAGGGTTASLNISAITTSGSHNQMLFNLARIA